MLNNLNKDFPLVWIWNPYISLVKTHVSPLIGLKTMSSSNWLDLRNVNLSLVEFSNVELWLVRLKSRIYPSRHDKVFPCNVGCIWWTEKANDTTDFVGNTEPRKKTEVHYFKNFIRIFDELGRIKMKNWKSKFLTSLSMHFPKKITNLISLNIFF